MEAMSTVNTDRVAGVVNDALAALHEVLERHRVTEAEWHAALAFLTEVGRADEFILLSDVTRTSVLVDTMEHGGDDSGATASDVEGPLYVDDPPWRERPVRVYEDYEGMGDADVLFVRGSVTSTDGTPLPDAVIDIWQTGPNGGYDIWDERQPEYNFRGRWRVEDEGGAYEFQTMLPKPYTVPIRRPRRPLPRGGRPASLAPGPHPLQGHGARAPPADHAGLLPRRPLPRERHHRRGQAGARATGRSRRATTWSARSTSCCGRPLERDRSRHGQRDLRQPRRGHRARARRVAGGRAARRALHRHAGPAADHRPPRGDRPAGDVLRRGPQRRALSRGAARARGCRPRGGLPRLVPRDLVRARRGRGARAARARRPGARGPRAAARRLPAAGRRAHPRLDARARRPRLHVLLARRRGGRDA